MELRDFGQGECIEIPIGMRRLKSPTTCPSLTLRIWILNGGGCCTVFPYFIGRILELPLTTTQDYALFHILGDYSIELWKRQIGLIMEKHGLVSFIVHPDYVGEERALGVYKALLDYVSRMRDERDVWIALPRGWSERSQMRLVREGGRWRIDGRGHERARIAYASVEGGQLVYTLPTVAKVQLAQVG